MKKLSLMQEFFLCALKPQGSTSFKDSTENSACLVAGGLFELLLDEYVFLEDKKIIITKDLTTDKMYLEPLYSFLKDSKPMNIEVIIEKLASDNNKKSNELFQLVGMSLTNDGFVTTVNNSGLFRNKLRFIAQEVQVTKVVEKLRAEFLEEGNLSEDVIVLAALLNKSSLIKKYFSKYEVQKLSQRLKEIKKIGRAHV